MRGGRSRRRGGALLARAETEDPPGAARRGLFGLDEPEKDAGPAVVPALFLAPQIPEEGPGGGVGLRIGLAAPHGPDRAVKTFDALVRGEDSLEGREHLESFEALPVATPGEQRPEVTAAEGLPTGAVLLSQVAVAEVEEPMTLPFEGRRRGSLVDVEGPREEIALLGGVGRLPPDRPDAVGVFAWSPGTAEERPGKGPLLKSIRPVGPVAEEEPPGVIHLRRTASQVRGEQEKIRGRVRSSDAFPFLEVKRPGEEATFVPGDDLRFIDDVGSDGGRLGFRANDRPGLPAVHAAAAADVEERRDEIPGDDVALAGLEPEGEEGEADFVAEKSVAEVAVEGGQGEVVVGAAGRLLPEVEGE